MLFCGVWCVGGGCACSAVGCAREASACVWAHHDRAEVNEVDAVAGVDGVAGAGAGGRVGRARMRQGPGQRVNGKRSKGDPKASKLILVVELKSSKTQIANYQNRTQGSDSIRGVWKPNGIYS